MYVALAPEEPIWGMSMATAYVGLVLVGLTLAIGPWNRLRARRNPVSTYLRRDIGIWAGLVSVLHVVFGLQVHFRGRMWLYFVPEGGHSFPLRIDPFGLTNYAGLVATFVLLMLLVLSNDASLRALGPGRWKSLQRWNYAGALLILAHGAVYQIIEKRSWGFVAAGLVIALAAMAMQLAGYRLATKKA